MINFCSSNLFVLWKVRKPEKPGNSSSMRRQKSPLFFWGNQKLRKSPDRKKLPCPYCEKVPLWVKTCRQETALQKSNKSALKNPLPFVTQYRLYLDWRKYYGKWHLIQNQQRLREIFKEPPLTSYRKGKPIKGILFERSSEGQITSFTVSATVLCCNSVVANF